VCARDGGGARVDDPYSPAHHGFVAELVAEVIGERRACRQHDPPFGAIHVDQTVREPQHRGLVHRLRDRFHELGSRFNDLRVADVEPEDR
jgi:hypothetical protein